jgi:hypothetical protein
MILQLHPPLSLLLRFRGLFLRAFAVLGMMLVSLPLLSTLSLSKCEIVTDTTTASGCSNDDNAVDKANTHNHHYDALNNPLPEIITMNHLQSFVPYDAFGSNQCEIAPRLRIPLLTSLPQQSCCSQLSSSSSSSSMSTPSSSPHLITSPR